MQYIKDEIKQRIIDAAREEFLEKGFEKASIRTITAKAKTSKSNLYNYFKDKNHLFNSVLEPTITKIQEGLELVKLYDSSKGIDSYTKEAQKRNIRIVIQFVRENISDVKLLLFNAQGSSLESFKVDVVDALSDILYQWVEAIAPGKGVSRVFARCVAYFYLSIIEQLIVYGVPQEQAEKVQEELLSFVYNGWKGVLK